MVDLFEEARLKPALGPTPWPMVLLDTLPMLLAITVGDRLSGWRRWAVAGVFMAFTTRSVSIVEDAREQEARRRGVEYAGDGPDWPPPSPIPRLAVAAGIGLMTRARRRRGTHLEGAVWALANAVVDELHKRWRWRHHPVLGD